MAIEKPIHEIITSIENGEYTIPEFQRGYVWNAEQVKKFIKSLYLGYPTGSFLIWKTNNPSKTKGESKPTNFIFNQLILDGQQRLTTIYTIFKGKTPDWYEGVSLRTDLYFNLDTFEFKYYMQTEMENKKEWIHVSNFLNQGVEKFLEHLSTLEEEVRNYYYKKLSILNRLNGIKNYGYYIKEVPDMELEKIVEIFNLVNSSGTTLTEADLATAIVTSRWPEIKNEFRTKIKEYESYGYKFDFGFFIRCLNIVACERGLFIDIEKKSDEELISAWKQLNQALLYLINILREHAFIDSSENLTTDYVLYTMIYYLSKNNYRFPTQEEMNKFIYWMFMAQLWGLYSGSSVSYLEKDIKDLKTTNSVDTLINNLKMFRGSNLDLTPEDFYLQGTRSRIFPIFYAAIRSREAKDWNDLNLPLYSNNIGNRNKLEKHHIFPKSQLYKFLDSKKSVDKGLVNEIANMALITERTNKEIFNKLPKDYLVNIPGQELVKQFVPTKTELWETENYKNFLGERRKLLAEGINRFLNSYYSGVKEEKLPGDLEYFKQKVQEIELAIRDKVAEILTSNCEVDAYEEFVPQDKKDKVKLRLDGFLKQNPGEDKERYRNFRKKLDFFELQEYRDVIVFKQNWNYFEDLFGSKQEVENRFNQLTRLRNAFSHVRDVNEVTLKDGEAAIAWFTSILKMYNVPEVLETNAQLVTV